MVTRIRAVLGVPVKRQKLTRADQYPAELLLSPIRTITVGSGITPDLLTFLLAQKALAGFQRDIGNIIAD